MREPRILILLGSIPLYGLELATIESGRMLQEAGVEVLFVTNAHWGHQGVNPRLDSLGLAHRGLIFFGALERGATLRRILRFATLQMSQSLALLRIIDDFRPTHLQITDLWDFVNFGPALWMRRSVRLVFCGHTAPDLRHRLLRWAFAALVRRASAIVVVSEFLAAHFRGLGASPQQLLVIPNGPPRRPLEAQAGPIPPPRRDCVLRLLYVGQITAHKGVALLVDAVLELLARGVALECFLLGDASSTWALAQRARVSEAGAGSDVVFVGYVPDPTPWYHSADVHVAPSLFEEPFGQVVVEAKAAGRPSIVSDGGGLRELVTDGSDGCVCPRGDVTCLEGAIRSFAGDTVRAREFGVRARASLSALGLDRLAERWTRLYELHG